jgi:hypothetical protein
MDLITSSAVNLPMTSANLRLVVVWRGIEPARCTYSGVPLPVRFSFTMNFVFARVIPSYALIRRAHKVRLHHDTPLLRRKRAILLSTHAGNDRILSWRVCKALPEGNPGAENKERLQCRNAMVIDRGSGVSAGGKSFGGNAIANCARRQRQRDRGSQRQPLRRLR